MAHDRPQSRPLLGVDLARSAMQRLTMVSAARPGGWTIAEDIDLGGPAVASAAERYVAPVECAPVYRKIFEALQVLLSQDGRDPAFGASLPAALHQAGLHEIGAVLHAPIVAGGPWRDCMRLTLEYLRSRLVSAGLPEERDITAFVQLTYDASFRYVPLFMVTAWSRRPP